MGRLLRKNFVEAAQVFRWKNYEKVVPGEPCARISSRPHKDLAQRFSRCHTLVHSTVLQQGRLRARKDFTWARRASKFKNCLRTSTTVCARTRKGLCKDKEDLV